MSVWTFINNEFVREEEARLHFRDLAVQRGYGVFDFFVVARSQPLFLDDHLERFFFSASQMRLALHVSKEEMKTLVAELIRRNETVDAGIRLTLTGGISSDGYTVATPNLIISQHSIQPPPAGQKEKGIRLLLHSFQRQLPEIKTIDYIMAIWLQPLVRAAGADDLLYHEGGMISECPRSNFFIVSAEGRLITPATGILKGITRNRVLALAKHYFPVEERPISLAELPHAAEAFITSTTKQILPVSHINDQRYACPGPLTLQLQKLLGGGGGIDRTT